MVKEKVLDLANHIGMKKPGSKSAYKPTDPEYMILEPVVTDEMAEVGLCLEFRKPKSAEEVALLCGKPVDRNSKTIMGFSSGRSLFC